MNILISTTSNWNPGDDFIRYGVKNLLNDYSEINWIHYDRNPDYFKSDVWEMGSNHKSNIMNNPIDWSEIDAVVLAGSPEFLHGPLAPLYEGLAQHNDIPLLAIGVGYSFDVSNLQLSINEHNVLKRDNTLIITRQYDLQDKLEELLDKSVYCLPCPALFALPYKITFRTDRILCIPQSLAGPQSICKEDYDLMQRWMQRDCDIACHYIKDFQEFGGFFTSDAKDLLNKINGYLTVVSNRLHGGIVALGVGSDVTFINSSNRVQKALEPYKPYLQKDGFYQMLKHEKIAIMDAYDTLIADWMPYGK